MHAGKQLMDQTSLKLYGSGIKKKNGTAVLNKYWFLGLQSYLQLSRGWCYAHKPLFNTVLSPLI